MAIIAFAGRAGSGKDTAAKIVQELYPDMNWQIKGFADKLREVASVFLGIPAEELRKQEVKMQLLGPEWDYYKAHYRLDGQRYDLDRIFKTAEAALESVPESGYSEGYDEYQMRIRDFLQILGTNAVRDKLHPQSWVNALMVNYVPFSFKWKWHEGHYHCTCAECGKTFMGHKLQRACKECCDSQAERWPNWLITDCRFPNELEAVKSRQGTCIRIVRPDNPYPKSNHESETALDGVELLTIINDGSLEQLKLRIKEVIEPIINHAKSH